MAALCSTGFDLERRSERGARSLARSPGQIVFNYSPVRGLPLDTSYGIEAGLLECVITCSYQGRKVIGGTTFESEIRFGWKSSLSRLIDL